MPAMHCIFVMKTYRRIRTWPQRTVSRWLCDYTRKLVLCLYSTNSFPLTHLGCLRRRSWVMANIGQSPNFHRLTDCRCVLLLLKAVGDHVKQRQNVFKQVEMYSSSTCVQSTYRNRQGSDDLEIVYGQTSKAQTWFPLLYETRALGSSLL